MLVGHANKSRHNIYTKGSYSERKRNIYIYGFEIKKKKKKESRAGHVVDT